MPDNKNEKLVFEAEDGTKDEFTVEAKVRLNGSDYLLVSYEEDDDAAALIFKDISEDGSEEACYVVLEDEDEIQALIPLFADILEDTEIEL